MTHRRLAIPSTPWAWVPTLYMAEGLPNFVVMELMLYLFKDMGLTDKHITLVTGLFYLPWVLKPIWSPLVDVCRTKRFWIITTQLIGTCGLAAIALTLHTTWWLAASLSLCWVMAFTSATHDIAADGFYILALTDHEQAVFVGIRSLFFKISRVFVTGGMLALAGWVEHSAGTSAALAWSIALSVGAVLFAAISLWHLRVLPHAAADGHTERRHAIGGTVMETIREVGHTFVVFFHKPHIWSALLFIVLFRFPEALLVKIASLFMKADAAAGGLALSNETISLVNSFPGVIGLSLGGVLGGILVSRYGMRRCFWPMVAALTVPDALYIFLAATQTASVLTVGTCVLLEQFGYGIGYTAYMLYLVYFSTGERSTSVFALCTALTSLGMMVPGMFAGWLTESVGYLHFFILVIFCCLVTVAVSACVKYDPNYGLKDKA